MSGIGEANANVAVDSKMKGIFDHEVWGRESGDANRMSLDSDVRFDGFEFDEQKALRAFAKFVCSAHVPPKLVEGSDFRELANKFNPRFKISVKEVESECMKLYEERKETIQEILENFEGHISISMEVLKYYNFCKFMCLSAHFIDENWKLRKWALYFISKDAFGKITDIIKKVHELSSSEKSLPLWNHKIFYLQRALKLWAKGEFSCPGNIDLKNVPSTEEWKKLEGVCEIVGRIYEVSHALFETKHLTANVYLYHLHELRELLIKMSTDSDSFIRTIAEDMLKKFGKYWDDMYLLLEITAALDPRFKMKYVEFVCSKVKGRDRNSQAADVLGAIRKQFDVYVIRFPEKETFRSESSSSDSDSEGESPIHEHVSHTFGVLKEYHQFIQSNKQTTKKSDLDCYLEEPILRWSQDFSALTWWKTAGARFPTLSRMARDFLGIPVSLATSYEAFYTEPRPVNEHIIRLKPDLGIALMCTRIIR